MFGLGKKDEDGKQVRIEHRGNYTRASRTGGVAVRVEKEVGPVNLQPTLRRGCGRLHGLQMARVSPFKMGGFS